MNKILCVLVAISICSPAVAQVAVEVHPNQRSLLQSDDPHLAANKKLVYEFMRLVIRTRNMDKAADFMAEDYIQHAPMIATGRAPLVEYFSRLPRQPVKDEIENLVTIVAEGDLVSLFFRHECQNPRMPGETYTTTGYDMFRVENGLIVEHWGHSHIRAEDNPPDCIH